MSQSIIDVLITFSQTNTEKQKQKQNLPAVTSSIMLRSQNKNNHFDIFNIIVGENFLTQSSNMFLPVTIFRKISFSIWVKFDRYFNGQLLVKCTKYAFIRVQHVKIIGIDILILDLGYFRFNRF